MGKWRVTGMLVGVCMIAGMANAQAATPEPATKAEPAGQPQQVKVEAVETKVIDLGGFKERRRLKLTPKAGTTTSFNMTVKTTAETSSPDGPGFKEPPSSLALKMVRVVDRVEANGDFRTTTTVEDAKSAPAADANDKGLKEKEAAYNELKGMKIVMTVDDRGFIKSMTTELAGNGGDREGTSKEAKKTVHLIAQTLIANAIVLPEEPIGVATIWKTRTNVAVGAIKVQFVTDYTVKELTETKALLEVRVSQTAKGQTLTRDGQPGLTMTLTKFSGSGEGMSSLALDLGLATSVRLSGKYGLEFELAKDGQKLTSTIAKTTHELAIDLVADAPATGDKDAPADKK